MQQNYVLDAIAGQGWLGSLTQLTGITIGFYTGKSAYVEPAGPLSAGQQFTVYYRVNNTTGYTQNVYGQIVYTPGGTDVIHTPETYWTYNNLATGMGIDISVTFTTGTPTTHTFEIQAGHAEYAITTNSTGAGSITITPIDAGGPPYYPGQTIRATAVSSGGTFTGWSGYLAGYGTQSPVDFDMPLTDITINAAFTGADVYGSCCIGGNCSLTTQANCAGTWQGAGTSCVPNPCSAGGDCTNPSGADGTNRCINGYVYNCSNGSWEPAFPITECPVQCTGTETSCINGYINDCEYGTWVPSTDRCLVPTQANMFLIAAVAFGAIAILSLLTRGKK